MSLDTLPLAQPGTGIMAALIALVIDGAIGWPAPIHARLSHPVVWFGAAITALERRLNRARWRRSKGAVLVLIMLVLTGLPAVAVQSLLVQDGWCVLITAILGWPFLAARSLHEHVAAVARPLTAGDLAASRKAVAMIVGRDMRAADAPAIARASIESLAENASDGVFAPLLWFALAGLPGLVIHKTINTMDSMIGHRNDRYRHFGTCAARLDDLVNLIPARLSAFFLALAALRRIRTVLARAMVEASWHRSPNAGWPEAAMAAALNVRLSGPRVYDGQISDEPWVNAGAPDPDADDIGRGLALFARACGVAALILATFAAGLTWM